MMSKYIKVLIIAHYTMPDFSGPEALQLLQQAGTNAIKHANGGESERDLLLRKLSG